jgi:hypothetical protein
MIVGEVFLKLSFFVVSQLIVLLEVLLFPLGCLLGYGFKVLLLLTFGVLAFEPLRFLEILYVLVHELFVLESVQFLEVLLQLLLLICLALFFQVSCYFTTSFLDFS